MQLNESNILNSSQISNFQKIGEDDFLNDHFLPTIENKQNESIISVSLFDLDKNIYMESQYSFETLKSTKTFIAFNTETNEPIGLDIKKFVNTNPEVIELNDLNDVICY